jgi:predicted transporter
MRSSATSRGLLTLSYLGSFVLGALVDIVRHSADRIVPAVQEGFIDQAIGQRIMLAAVLTLTIMAGVYFGSRWSKRRFGKTHHAALLAVFVLTPAIVYVIEH